MITYGKNARDGVKLLNVYEIKGLSTDEKPTDVGNGSLFLEMDTAQVFFFDGESGMWINVGTIGGGGGDTSALEARIDELLAENSALDSEKRTLATLNGEYLGYLADIATAINGKGGVVPADYADYDTAIEELPSGGVQAVELLENGFGIEGAGIRGDVSSATKIHAGAFAFPTYGVLMSPDFPNCSIIGSGAFYGCGMLNINFPVCKVIQSSAFCGGVNTDWYCSAYFPACTHISEYAFMNALVKSADFPVCKAIPRGVFSNCSKLSTVNFPVCETIDNHAFNGCYALITADFPACSYIGSWAFQSCKSLATANFPACSYIGSYAFQSCSSLATVNFPACEIIGSYAFTSCPELNTVSLPACSSVGGYAFSKCYNLLSLYLLGSSVASLFNAGAFISTPISGYTASTGGVTGSIFVRASLLDQWKTKTNWTMFSSRFVGLTDEEIANL